MHRRNFLGGILFSDAAFPLAKSWGASLQEPAVMPLPAHRTGEDVLQYIKRQTGGFDNKWYCRILGAANEFKEGDQIIGVAAADDASRLTARQLLANTRLSDIDSRAPHQDKLYRYTRSALQATNAPNEPNPTNWTFGHLKRFLIAEDESTIKQLMPAWSSDVIGTVVKLMTNDELARISAKVFNPLPGSQIGAKGYLGARIQPNSPTDNLDDILWQVLCGWSYAVGDVVLGNNPVSSEPASVLAIEQQLKKVLEVFRLADVLPHCVLSHIDVQAAVEKLEPESTALWFQSIAGCDSANETFDISVDKMKRHAASRVGKYGLYFETGQGADSTNGHGHGFDMVLHESRKYGFARALQREVSRARPHGTPWVHLNDVAGFIGPEVFRTKHQLVRCCLEDLVMAKLHGLCIGLDVCSTLHMDISLDDLDWCLDQIMPANPAYLMALPTKIDPMLGYLTTGFQDHVRLRRKFGYKVNDAMQNFFQELQVIDSQGRPTGHFGDPTWVYLQYLRRQGDRRSDQEIQQEGRSKIQEVRNRGVFVATGYDEQPGRLESSLRRQVRHIYDDAKQSIWSELTPAFVRDIPRSVSMITTSQDRNDYILHPETGERFNPAEQRTIRSLRQQYAGRFNVQIVISDGLNALALMEAEQLQPYLQRLEGQLKAGGYRVAPQRIVVRSGRVRAGYRIGEGLFGDLEGRRAIVHIIGERPGTGHRTFSAYITSPEGKLWGQAGKVDHNITKVVSGIARTALDPITGADTTVRLLTQLNAS